MKLKIRDPKNAQMLDNRFQDRGIVEFCGVPLAVEEIGVSHAFGVTSWDYSFVEVGRIKWSGEGVPPVATVCEALTIRRGATDKKWIVCEVIFSSKHYVIIKSSELIGQDEAVCLPSEILFRTIRTPEQIAAEERAGAIRQMHQDILCNGFALGADEIVAKLVDAGYRKQ